MSDFKFEFDRPIARNYSEEDLLNELERVAKYYEFNHFSRKDFDKVSKIHSSTIERFFNGSWSAAIEALDKRLEIKNIYLYKAKHNHKRNISEELIFKEMERIWIQLGHRPSRTEWTTLNPSMSYDTIYRHFGGWTNACLKFIEFKSGTPVATTNANINNEEITNKIISKRSARNGRSISLNIRMKVLIRDNFRCVFCGKSPATDFGTKLHVDHIIPFSKGGSNSFDNLQTLCEKCNIGKSDEEISQLQS